MDYVVARRELESQVVLSIRERLGSGEIPAFLQGAFAELFGRLGSLGVPPAGHPFVVYHAFGPSDMDAEVCVPVSRAVAVTGRIQAREIPAATVARTLHVGPYEELGGAYQALTEWIERHGFEASGPVQERYLNGPGDAAGPADFRTEVEIPIVPAPAAIPA